MKLEESWDKSYCDECEAYEYVYELTISDNDYESVKLCKKCLLKLLKLIIER